MAAIVPLACGDAGHSNQQISPTHFDYSANKIGAPCDAEKKLGRGGQTNNEYSAKGIRYNVRAPINYDPTRHHGLIVVFAPAGASAVQTEKLMGFTQLATGAGYLVAYADHATLGPAAVQELATIPARIVEKWCVDPNRVFLTGHSDGGTISHIAALLPEMRKTVTGIAPSAAGVVAGDLQFYGCREPLPVMIMHSKNDALFPGFGRQTADWWARCNQCEIEQQAPLANGCIAYRHCAKPAPTWYCEGDAGHRAWPNRNATMLEFFSQSLN